MKISKSLKMFVIIVILPFMFASCKSPDGKYKLPGADARKFPADPKKRVEQNLKEGRGFKLNDAFSSRRGGVFDFANSNELWRASLDIIDFMPLSSVNYSGGIIITDWYSDNSTPNESIKISIRFLTNEIRSDALDIKIFNRECSASSLNCTIKDVKGNLVTELKKEILKRAAKYKNDKNTDYSFPKLKDLTKD